jgi:serine/threonine protein phosphatase PrpC
MWRPRPPVDGGARTIPTITWPMRFSRVQETLVTSLAPGDLPPRFEEHAYVMLVADGLGEDAAGARASRVVLSALASLAIEYGKWNVRISPRHHGLTSSSRVPSSAVGSNDAVVRASEEHPELANMATSLTALYLPKRTSSSRTSVTRERICSATGS